MINHNLNINNVSNKEKKEINSGIRSPKVADLNVGTNDPTYIYRFSSSVNRKDGENRDPEKQKLGAWWISSSDFLKIESEYLKHLENKWFFKDLGEASQVEFQVDFELKNKMLNLFMNKSFDLGLIKIADAFQKRADELFNKT